MRASRLPNAKGPLFTKWGPNARCAQDDVMNRRHMHEICLLTIFVHLTWLERALCCAAEMSRIPLNEHSGTRHAHAAAPAAAPAARGSTGSTRQHTRQHTAATCRARHTRCRSRRRPRRESIDEPRYAQNIV
jgi:hypothetical protein